MLTLALKIYTDLYKMDVSVVATEEGCSNNRNVHFIYIFKASDCVNILYKYFQETTRFCEESQAAQAQAVSQSSHGSEQERMKKKNIL